MLCCRIASEHAFAPCPWSIIGIRGIDASLDFPGIVPAGKLPARFDQGGGGLEPPIGLEEVQLGRASRTRATGSLEAFGETVFAFFEYLFGLLDGVRVGFGG